MNLAYQIIAFYCISGMVAVALLGYYPHIDPAASYATRHVLFAKICIHLLLTLLVVTVAYLVSCHFVLSRFSPPPSARIHLYRGIALSIFAILLTFGMYKIGLATLAGQVPAKMHFHANVSLWVLLTITVFLAGVDLQKLVWIIENLRIQSGQPLPLEPFLDDEHSRGFYLAKRWLFLGINVWWPYLVLKYGLGLSQLSALYFLPVHLAGVMPFSYLKRKHKFKRTINPAYTGVIKNRERYVQVNQG